MLQDVEDPTFSKQSAHRWGWGCQLYALSYTRNRPWRSVGLWDVEAPTFSKQSAHRCWWECQLYSLSYTRNRPWRSIELWDVEAPTFSRQSAQRRRWGCQPYVPAAPLPPGRFLVLIPNRGRVDPRAVMRLEGLGRKEIRILRNVSLTHGAQHILGSRQLCSHSGSSQHFMQPESSLPCSQEPSTGLYTEPHQSDPYHPILSF
jgi:hypothetical protein